MDIGLFRDVSTVDADIFKQNFNLKQIKSKHQYLKYLIKSLFIKFKIFYLLNLKSLLNILSRKFFLLLNFSCIFCFNIQIYLKYLN